MPELKPEAPRFYVENSHILKWNVTDRKTNNIIADGYSHAYKAKNYADKRNKDSGCAVTIGYLEPWRYDDNDDAITDVHGNIVLANNHMRRRDRRIVACINACAGIETEKLENVFAYLDGEK